jgi:hypothetical protein
VTTPADELRAAAARLRELATDATDGPWIPDDPNTRWGDDRDHQLVGGGKILATFDNDYKGPLNATYAAAMHPGVGAALADWLDSEAGEWDPDPDVIHTWDAHFERALAVARLINQEQQ